MALKVDLAEFCIISYEVKIVHYVVLSILWFVLKATL